MENVTLNQSPEKDKLTTPDGQVITEARLLDLEDDALDHLALVYEWDQYSDWEDKLDDTDFQYSFRMYLINVGLHYISEGTLDQYEEAYAGELTDREGQAREFYDQCYGQVPEELEYYINWSGYADDLYGGMMYYTLRWRVGTYTYYEYIFHEGY